MSSVTNRIYYIMGIILISTAISPISVLITTQLLPYNINEIFLIPGIILVLISNKGIRRSFISHVRDNQFFILSFALYLFLIIGIVTGENVAYSYGDFRTILIFLFFSTMVVKDISSQESIKQFIYDIFLVVSVLDSLYLLVLFTYFTQEGNRHIVMAVCPLVTSIRFLYKEKYISSGLFLSLLVYESALSSMRINYILILIYLLFLFIYLFTSIFKRKYSFTKTLVFVVIITIASIQIAPS